MTWNQYWYEDVTMVRAFRKADLERAKRKNAEAHLQGLYFYDAISTALGNMTRKKGAKPIQYPAEPYNLFEDPDERRRKQEETEALRANLYMEQMVRAGKNWGKQSKVVKANG